MTDILGFIPARGASKGIPNKNKRLFCGKPLVQWTIEAALASKCTRVVVSTADPDIAKIAIDCGAQFLLRPADLDELGEISLTEKHCLENVDRPDYFIRLQPTSPLRTAEDIDDGIFRLLFGRNMTANEYSVIGATSPRQHPNLMFWAHTPYRILPGDEWKRNRQQYREVMWVNGAFYGAYIGYYEKHGFDGPDISFLQMPQARSLDVDSELDWLIAESVMANV